MFVFLWFPEAEDIAEDNSQSLYKKVKKKKSKKKKHHRKEESSSDEESVNSKTENGSSEDEIGPPLPPSFKPAETSETSANFSPTKSQNMEDSDNEDVGPPLPPGFVKRFLSTERDPKSEVVEESKIKISKPVDEGDNDEEEEEDDDTAEEDDVNFFKPFLQCFGEMLIDCWLSKFLVLLICLQ